MARSSGWWRYLLGISKSVTATVYLNGKIVDVRLSSGCVWSFWWLMIPSGHSTTVQESNMACWKIHCVLRWFSDWNPNFEWISHLATFDYRRVPKLLRIVGIRRLGIAPYLVSDPRIFPCMTQPGHANELFFNEGIQGFGGAVNSQFLQGTGGHWG